MRRIDVRAAQPMNWPCLDAMLLARSVCKAPLYSADGGRAAALATAGATGSMPALMAAVFGDTRVSARVAKNQKTARCTARATRRKPAGELFDAAWYLSNHRDPGVGGTLTLVACDRRESGHCAMSG